MAHVTNRHQLAPPVPRKIVPVGKIPGLNKVDGTPAELSARELTAYEFGEHQASLRDEYGQQTADSVSHSDLKFLAAVLCDPNGNTLWTPEQAVEELGQYPKPIIDRLCIVAANVNRADAAAVDRAEKNSEETTNESSNGTSVSSSESPILVS
jgi:hypothetical protein